MDDEVSDVVPVEPRWEGELRSLENGVVVWVADRWDGDLAATIYEVWPVVADRNRAWKEGRAGIFGPGKTQITRVGARLFVATVVPPATEALLELAAFCSGRDGGAVLLGKGARRLAEDLLASGGEVASIGTAGLFRSSDPFTSSTFTSSKGVVLVFGEVDGRWARGSAELVECWPEVRADHELAAPPLGTVRVTSLGNGSSVAVLTAVVAGTQRTPVRYEALRRGLEALRDLVGQRAVHVAERPYPATDWNAIEALLKSVLVDEGVSVVVHPAPHDLPWLPALAAVSEEGLRVDAIDLEVVVRDLHGTRDGVLVLGEGAAVLCMGNERIELNWPVRCARPSITGLERTLAVGATELFELRGRRWRAIPLDGPVAQAVPLGSTGLLMVDPAGEVWVYDGRWARGPSLACRSGRLVALHSGAVWLPDEGPLELFRGGRWWAGADLNGLTQGAVAVERGWVGVASRQLSGPLELQAGPGRGCVVPAAGGGAWLLDDAVYLLDSVADTWRRVHELPFTVDQAVVQRDGTVFVRVGGELKNIQWAPVELGWAPVGSRVERAVGLLATLAERGWLVEPRDEQGLAACIDDPDALGAWCVDQGLTLSPALERVLAVFRL